MGTKLGHIILAASMLVSSIGFAQNTSGPGQTAHKVTTTQEKSDELLSVANTDLIPVTFEVNQSVFKPSPLLDKVVNALRDIEHTDDFKLDYIYIGTSSSIDGPERTNIVLSKKRCDSFIDYISRATDLPKEKFRGEGLGEEWDYMLSLVAKNHPEYYQKLKDVMERYSGADRREAALRKDAKLWNYLKNEIFPACRHAKIIIVGSSTFESTTVMYLTAGDEDVAMQVRKIPNPSERGKIETIEKVEPTPIAETKALEFEPDATVYGPIVIEKTPDYDDLYISVKTNLLKWGLLITNFGAEIGSGHFSLDVPFCYSPYNLFKVDQKVRLLSVQPEFRYWTRGCQDGHFFGLHGSLAGYNITFPSTDRYQDDGTPAWGFGLGWGYATQFGRDSGFGLEFNLGAGFIRHYTNIYNNVKNGLLKGHEEGFYWGPTRASISIYYKFKIER